LSHSDVKERFLLLDTQFSAGTFNGILYRKEIISSDDGAERIEYKMETVNERKKLAVALIKYLLGFEFEQNDEYALKLKYIKFKSVIDASVNSLPEKLVTE